MNKMSLFLYVDAGERFFIFKLIHFVGPHSSQQSTNRKQNIDLN